MNPVDELVDTLKKFPGLGIKSARRITFHLMQQDENYLKNLGNLISSLKNSLHVCSQCGNISDRDPCSICSNPLRDKNVLCIVEDVEALSAFESAGIYNGLYHVLGGKNSQIENQELADNVVEFLEKHIKALKPNEIIIATSPRIEGDIAYYSLMDVLKNSKIKKISRLAVGLPVGSSIELADRLTLHTALETRRQVN